MAWVDDGICQHHANTEASGWDDGDCEVLDKEKYPNCTQVPGYKYYATSLGNGYCNGNLNTKECGYDGGGCNEFNALFPRCVVGGITKIVDGICHGNKCPCRSDCQGYGQERVDLEIHRLSLWEEFKAGLFLFPILIEESCNRKKRFLVARWIVG